MSVKKEALLYTNFFQISMSVMKEALLYTNFFQISMSVMKEALLYTNFFQISMSVMKEALLYTNSFQISMSVMKEALLYTNFFQISMSVKKEGMIVVTMQSVLTLTAATTVPATLASLEMEENAWVCVCVYIPHTHIWYVGVYIQWNLSRLSQPGWKEKERKRDFLTVIFICGLKLSTLLQVEHGLL